jgi:DNA-binding transcriptional regulator YbjK
MSGIAPFAGSPGRGHTGGRRQTPVKARAERRPRRHDPDRKTRILDATLDVLVEHGMAGTTHRHIAAQADVPLGSVTYHFANLADLQLQAFARYVEQQTAVFESAFDDVETHDQFVDVLVDFVHGGPARHRSAILGFELHLAALRNPELRTLMHVWTKSSQKVLARHVGADDAARLDALLEGMIMHALLAIEPATREVTRIAITTTVDPSGRPGT